MKTVRVKGHVKRLKKNKKLKKFKVQMLAYGPNDYEEEDYVIEATNLKSAIAKIEKYSKKICRGDKAIEIKIVNDGVILHSSIPVIKEFFNTIVFKVKPLLEYDPTKMSSKGRYYYINPIYSKNELHKIDLVSNKENRVVYSVFPWNIDYLYIYSLNKKQINYLDYLKDVWYLETAKKL